MHWGHVVSEDLLHWKHLPIALTPGDEFDKDGCFSGTSLVVGDRLYVFYTGFIYNENPELIKQQQCLAYTDDGITFHKLGLIIGEDNLPKGYAPNDFRDPSVYKEDDHYVMLVAVRKLDGRGNILKYVSKDLRKWDFVSEILSKDSDGIMIECPDYVKDLRLLINCEQFQPVEEYLHHNLHSNYYRIGEFKNEKFVVEKTGMIDYGFDFYAPQMFSNEYIMVAWMDMWDRDNPSEVEGFAGSLTSPRRVKVEDGKLLQTPIIPQEIEIEEVVKNQYVEHCKVGFYKIETNNFSKFSLKIRKGQSHETLFSLNGDKWVFDRSCSGKVIKGKETDKDSLNGIRIMPYHQKEQHEIYIILDEFSVEIFVDGYSLTSLIYPEKTDDVFELNCDASYCKLTKYKNS